MSELEKKDFVSETELADSKEDEKELQPALEQEEADDFEAADDVGIISRGTKISGHIFTKGHLDIEGDVEGNIEARGNVRVSGNITGDITCGGFIVSDSRLKVNIFALNDVSIGEKSKIEGDIKGRRVTVQGEVVGNIQGTELVQIGGTAAVKGNITAGAIAVGIGAEINGNIKMKKK